MKLSKHQLDSIERIGWTFLESFVGVLATSLSGIDPLWAVPIASFLAAVKSLVAKHIGDPNSASTLPAYVDEAVKDIAIKVAKATVKKVGK